ncbi:hypothetical protein GPECTOR_5g272 [Gonium pectorale]|uniref:Uncharacterized protein n=1 Tax=Gonium pectorale TaxID=33097 RepID=A0A150GWA3_GONPE|nr:hypothetical protein GPECTOR_5g272 [Gonium pectorale]|eukprot:KXZ54176.1 hypothetical protein GPECTOR_5g272 [Gonium pectorale]
MVLRGPLLAVTAASLLLIAVQAATDVAVSWTGMPALYNPSLVEHGDKYLSALKRTTFLKAKGKTFWLNTLYMCVGPKDNLAGLQCQLYNPWREGYLECEFDSRVRDGKTDVTGLGDVKVWVWPGKGVYTIFGRKPERAGTDGPYCPSQVVYDQWIAQVIPEQGSGQWRLQKPLRLYLDSSYQYPKQAPYIMEKNWMPWVYRAPNGTEVLLVTHSVNPHRVLAVSPSGACTVAHETPGDPALFARFGGHDVHGGPPVVYVPAALSRDGKPYYLGIMHFIVLLGGSGGGGGGGGDAGLRGAAGAAAAGRGATGRVLQQMPLFLVEQQQRQAVSIDAEQKPLAASDGRGPKRVAVGGGSAGGRVRRRKKVKLYRHFAYKFAAEPPFAITAISDELPLTFYRNAAHPTKAFIAYVAGFHMTPNGTLLISYGAGDREARVRLLALAELEATFTGRVAFLQHAAQARARGQGQG